MGPRRAIDQGWAGRRYAAPRSFHPLALALALAAPVLGLLVALIA